LAGLAKTQPPRVEDASPRRPDWNPAPWRPGTIRGVVLHAPRVTARAPFAGLLATPPACRIRPRFPAVAQQGTTPPSLDGKPLMPLVLILNGPNLNLLGKRQPEIYGRETLDDVGRDCAALGDQLGLETSVRQSNHEGQIVDWIHEARETAQGIVINPGALTHTSIAILDALHAFEGPVIEVHISNVHKRESFRHHSYVSLRADGIIVGCGTEGYRLALRRLATLLNVTPPPP
jgi:3-dehydroquinate dehydratase-2